MFAFKSLTNVRPTKDLGKEIICAPTEGQFKVTPDAALALGVIAGGYLQIVEGPEGGFYAIKGENGRGGKLASAGKSSGGALTFSAAAAWEPMGGSTELNKHYTVKDEDAFYVDAEGNVVEEDGDGVLKLFPLEFSKDVEKQKRVRKAKDTSVEETTDAKPEETTDTASTSFDEI